MGGYKARSREKQARHQSCKIYRGSYSKGHATATHHSESEGLLKFCILDTSLASPYSHPGWADR